MATMTLKVKNQSIDNTGIKQDYQDALCEYIWNGFEANATIVSLSYKLNRFEGIEEILIEDNGDGIKHSSLDDTFGAFMASQKNTIVSQIKSQKNKGKGRFAFINFASEATWNTTYMDEGAYKSYTISLESSQKNEIDYSDMPIDANDNQTGTKVVFRNIYGITPENLFYKSLEDIFQKEFSWLLYLKKNDELSLLINGEPINYEKYINQNLSLEENDVIESHAFNTNLVVWNKRISERYYIYFVDNDNKVVYRQPTKFNYNTVEFCHSVVVKSSFFNSFDSADNQIENQIGLISFNQYHPTFKALNIYLQNLISKQLHIFMVEKSEEAIDKMIDKGSFPRFSKDAYDQLRYKDLRNVSVNLYCFEPRIFHKMNPIQEKSIFSFLNLLLISEERENITTIINEIVKLNPEQRETFASMLKKTKLEHIIDMLKMIETRYTVIEGLRKILYEYKNFSNERNHIQNIIEKHFWIFGEQYNLVTADKPMQTALEEYLYIIEGKPKGEVKNITQESKNKRMDIFLCGKRIIEDAYENDLYENLIIELKSPSVPLSTAVYRQIEDYMNIISKEEQFQTSLCKWKFISVCSSIDDDVISKYDAYKDKGKRFLVYYTDRYEIYAMRWEDVFHSFELRHAPYLDKLKYDKEQLVKQLSSSEKIGRGAADDLTEGLLATV